MATAQVRGRIKHGRRVPFALSTDKVGIGKGIGTSTPEVKLDVAGELQILSDSIRAFHFSMEGWPLMG